MPISVKRLESQTISAAVSDKVLYSASVELLDTDYCFCSDQEINFEPKSVKNPPVDLLVS